MGGIRTINGQLVFCPDQEKQYVIRHSENLGPDVVVTQSCMQLEPNKFYFLGNVSRELKIVQFVSKNQNILETYRGEYTILPRGKVVFPSTVVWDRELDNEEGYTYQFSITNNIGTFVKVKK